MQFSPTTPFKLWLDDRLIAAYQPGLSYTVREGNDWLRALVMGGPLPGSQVTTIELPDLSQTEIQPGAECPGWLKGGFVVMTGLRAGGLSGAAEVVKKEG
jgi:hypothetical protein